MNKHYFDIISENPDRVTHEILLDLRDWHGISSEADLKIITDQSKEQRCLRGTTHIVPRAVYLGTRDRGFEFLVENMARFRGGEILLDYSLDEAWHHLAPNGTPIPLAVKALIKN